MKFKQCLVIALPALLCGALLGYLAAPTPEPVEEPVAQKEPAARKARAQNDDAALNRLRARIQELEKQLAAAKAPAAEEGEPAETAEKQPQQDRQGPPGPGDFRARMEEFAKNDPERFAQMTNRFAQMRSEHLQRVQSRLDLLASINTSRMTPKQLEAHNRYQELVAQQTEMRDMMRPDQMDEMTEDQRREMFQQMRNIDREVRDLAQEERNTLLRATAQELGAKGDGITDAVEQIKAIYSVTESEGGPGGRGPGGPGGPGGFGGPGGRGGRGR